jgi:filamentous hemagglutinin
VLVPKLYLAQSSTVDLQDSGAIVAGNTVNLTATGDVNNSGHIVSNVATTVIGNNVVNSGVIGSGGTTAVAAVQDVRNVSGRIGGADTLVQAGRDVINETATAGVSKTLNESGFTSSASSQSTLATGTISASGNALILAGRDVDLSGASIDSGGSTMIGAGRDINVGTTTLTSTRDAGTNDGLNGGHDTVTQNVGSTITTGGSFTSVSGGNTTLTDASVKSAGDATMIAGNDLTVTAAKDTATHSEQSLGGPKAKHTASSYDGAVQGSDLNAGNNMTLGAGQGATASALLSQYGVGVAKDAATGGGNLAVLGSSVTTGSTAADGSMNGGATTLAATGNVTIGAVNETHDSQSWEHVEHSGFLSSDKTTDQKSSHAVDAVGATVAGDTVGVTAGHDLTIAGSTVASTNDMALSAGHDLTVTTTQNTSESSSFHQETKSGLGATGGAGISYGSSDQKDTTHDSSVTQNSSLVGSTNGSVTMAAGNDLHITGSDVIAAQNITGVAANVTIDSTTNTNHHDETQETKTSGFTLGVGGSVAQAISSAVDQSHAASDSHDGRAKALHAVAAAGNAGDAVGQLASGGTPDVSIELSWGTSHTKNTFTEDQTTQTGSAINAGGNATFIATGNGTPGSGNLTIAGSDVNARNVALVAQNQVNLVNSTNTDSTRSTNESSSASVGVSYGTKGWGVSASMSNSHGDSNSDAVTQNNTHVSASNNVTIVSGGDTNIVGANVSGNHVAADIGGNLNIQSVQDTTVSAAHQSSTGGGFSISQGGGSASISSPHGGANGNYAAVNEQAGIQAGSGGFDINVKGNTNLTGAYIGSDADASKNNLTTGTLTYSDIQDHSEYNSSTSGFSAGTQGFVPMMGQSDSGNSNATTKSGVSAGTITVTDAAGQAQDLAGLNRDTSNLNGTVSKLPDVSGVLGDELDVMSAANAAGQAVAKDIGTFADYKEAKARDGQKAAALLGETDLAVEYKAEGDLWGEGGDDRVMLHMAGGALLGGLGAGSVVGAMSGAAGAGASAYLAPALNDVADQFGDPGTAGHAVGNIIANLLATAAGGAVGGGVGAATASNVDAYNRQLHPDEKQRIKQLAGNNAVEEARLTAAACAMTNCYAEYPVGSVEYQQLKQIADYGASSALASERNLLSQQTGMFGYSTSGAFSDANVDAAKQFNNTYQITTRGVGAGEAVLGALGIAGAVASAPLSCTTGVGCIANAVVAGTSTDALIAGSKQAVFGQSESTYLNQALMGLGMSPAAAGILEVAFGIGAGAVAGGVVNALTDQAAALNKLGAASYQEFSTNGLQATPQLMQTQQAQALIREIQAGNPSMSAERAESIAESFIESGTSLPQVGVAAPGTTLVKVVPKGDTVSSTSGYWMTPQQAQEIATMTPEQAGQLLGLPAQQAANILRDGMDFYAITPKTGSMPNVFVSNVAEAAQGSVAMPGGAQQVIVPNRTQWTDPVKINPFRLN